MIGDSDWKSIGSPGTASRADLALPSLAEKASVDGREDWGTEKRRTC